MTSTIFQQISAFLNAITLYAPWSIIIKKYTLLSYVKKTRLFLTDVSEIKKT